VAQIFNLRTIRQTEARRKYPRPAECNSAIQQIENLRYAGRDCGLPAQIRFP